MTIDIAIFYCKKENNKWKKIEDTSIEKVIEDFNNNYQPDRFVWFKNKDNETGLPYNHGLAAEICKAIQKYVIFKNDTDLADNQPPATDETVENQPGTQNTQTSQPSAEKPTNDNDYCDNFTKDIENKTIIQNQFEELQLTVSKILDNKFDILSNDLSNNKRIEKSEENISVNQVERQGITNKWFILAFIALLLGEVAGFAFTIYFGNGTNQQQKIKELQTSVNNLEKTLDNNTATIRNMVSNTNNRDNSVFPSKNEFEKLNIGIGQLDAKIKEFDSALKDTELIKTKLSDGLTEILKKDDLINKLFEQKVVQEKFADQIKIILEDKKNGLNAQIAGQINNTFKGNSKAKEELANSLIKECIDTEKLKDAITKKVSTDLKAIIIPIQDFHTTSPDGLFAPLVAQLVNEKKYKVFIYNNDELTEINEKNKEDLKQNLVNNTSVLDQDFYNKCMSAVKNVDFVLIRGPYSRISPQINGPASFNGDRCSVIYLSNKNEPANDSADRRIQWKNLVTINNGSLRILDLDLTKPNKSEMAQEVVKEIGRLR